MPIQTNNPQAHAEAAIVALTALVAADLSLSNAVARMVGEIRAKYPTLSVDPGGPPPDPGVSPTTSRA